MYLLVLAMAFSWSLLMALYLEEIVVELPEFVARAMVANRDGMENRGRGQRFNGVGSRSWSEAQHDVHSSCRAEAVQKPAPHGLGARRSTS